MTTRISMKRLVFLQLVFIPALVCAQLANSPPVPDWLEGAPAYAQSFEQSDPLLMAVLLVAADRDVTLSVNGESQSLPASPARAVSLDITRRLHSGKNIVSFRSADGRPIRVAALLELNGDLKAKRWIATDQNWSSAPPTRRAAAEAFDLKKSYDAYNSWQLAKRGEQSGATDPSTLTLPPGFQAELIRSARPEEDSWVAMAFDPAGRITLAREKRGLLRFDPRSGGMEVIDDTLLECRGLLYAHGRLYAHANNSKALFSIEFPSAPRELLRTEGGVGHGRNHLKLGPDGDLWLANGNNVLLPKGIQETSPLRHFAPDQVIPNPWDDSMFDGNVELPAGHILRTGIEGRPVELFAGGLRNPLDLAFNRHGDLFTFDADMERDVGGFWYMPTRVLHVVSGADFGWRRGTGRFPVSHADTLPSVTDVGLASPTAIFFGYGAKMPTRYVEALFICDWSYGRILAVHLEPHGSSYRGTVEPFVAGRPLNVTDGCIGPDGSFWFVTGGRGTLSGLYRVSFRGEADSQPSSPPAPPLQVLRRRLESLHRGAAPSDLPWILEHLGHSDRFIRHAARVALETLPVDLWRDAVSSASEPWARLTGALALARLSGLPDGPVFSLPWSALTEEQQLAGLRSLEIGLARHGDPQEPSRALLLTRLEPLYPSPSFPLNQSLCRLLVRLRSSVVQERSLELLRQAKTSEELIFYPLHLRNREEGWSLDSRRLLFDSLNRAEKFPGASSYFKAIQDLRTEYAAATPPDQVELLASIIHPAKPVALSPHALPGHTFRNWKLEDLLPHLDRVSKGRSFAAGRAAAITAQCVFCHRVSASTDLPAGLFGPDLVQVSARFGRRDLLDHILDPSKFVDEKFRFAVIATSDGRSVSGSIESEDDERIVVKPNPLAPEVVEIGKSQVTSREVSQISPMPTGLLATLKEDQILDLLAFLEAGGNSEAPNFRD
jgi:putative heme-binding domain-containing protein